MRRWAALGIQSPLMFNAQQLLDEYLMEMRWRCLSLAADFDRVERAAGGAAALASDARVDQVRQALRAILEPPAGNADRAERVQLIFTDHTPAPPYRAAAASAATR
jgi:hypothetical protein